MSVAIRTPAVAGQFYPGDAARLRSTVEALLAAAKADVTAAAKALILPHAGYVYSGPVAAAGYAALGPAIAHITRVILLGPAHRVHVSGMALPKAEAFATPLGLIAIDSEVVQRLRLFPGVTSSDDAHALEHSLEVQLPFLQILLGPFSLVPIVVGVAPAESVASLLDEVWGGPETLIVVSSDLSHYHDYVIAQRMDADTARAIERGDIEHIDGEHACGCRPLNGLLLAAERRGLRAHTLDLRNSGDTAGTRDRVVGYGAFVLA